MYKKYYQRFLEANKGIQHYAAHSHHFWPDVTRDATIQYWDDSAKMVDDKWNYIFSTKIPAAQKLIAEVLHLHEPSQIAFAPNTHEFVYRLLSCFDLKKEIKVLTTDSEFYSFERQINRLSEDGNVKVDKVPTQDFSTFEDRFVEKIKSEHYDMIFLSQVFFNSGVAVQNLEKIVNAVKNPETMIVVDGYHAFMAIPTDLRYVQKRIFYIAGSYKYAQGGEGCCFMYVPPDFKMRPRHTGWFAGFSALAGKGGEVSYSADGFRFAGSTMDFAALYRLIAVLELFKAEKITVQVIHDYVLKLQTNFRAKLAAAGHPVLNEKNILHLDFNKHGHFYAFETGANDIAKKIHDDLYTRSIRTDYRGSRIRFGFGLYQEESITI
ncbi:aminotransferase class V-fold PLP-dependent enzyme [bacterium]|nr:aminotransferase class V-fold PLP-dependent enzyme [bacterium]